MLISPANERCCDIAFLSDPTIDPNSDIPHRKMGRHIASHSFYNALKQSYGSPCLVERILPNRELREGNQKWKILFTGDPNLKPLALERGWGKHTNYSFLGITHTLSTPGALSALRDLYQASLFRWDALICTSKSAKSAVESIFDHYDNELISRGGFPAQRIELPIIPLGIDPSRFCASIAKEKARQELGLANDAVVVLWTGRLELHCKAHHGATFRALAKAHQLYPARQWILLMYGTAVMKQVPSILKQLAQQLCPDVELHLLNGHDANLGSMARSASDLFISLADCHQETFGLTPVEAMAAGLPVVVSDWNGYRDTVVHGHTGYRIRTQSYNPGWSSRDLLQLASDESSVDRLSTRISSQIHIDGEQAGRSLAHLAANPSLSKQMAEFGQRHVNQNFTWRVILRQYEELTQELTRRRQMAISVTPSLKPLPPLQSIFKDWPTQELSDTSQLCLSQGMTAIELDRSLRSLSFQVYRREIAEANTILLAYKHLKDRGPGNLREMRRQYSHPDLPQAIGWLIKNGFVVAEP